LDITCVVYLDDILIFSRTQDEHDAHVRQVLDRLSAAGLYINPDKCAFDRVQVEFLGFLVGVDGIQMDPKKLSTILDWQPPTCVKEIQQWLGFTNFYRRFIKNYAAIATPLNTLTKASDIGLRTPFPLPPNATFTTAPVLRHFVPDAPTTITIDASDFAIGPTLTVLSIPLVTFPGINYDVHDKELLAIIESFRDFRAWLMGSPHRVTVRCDHKNLEYFMTRQRLNRRQARWSLFLAVSISFLITFPVLKTPPTDLLVVPTTPLKKEMRLVMNSILSEDHCRIIRPAEPSNSSSPLPSADVSPPSEHLAVTFEPARFDLGSPALLNDLKSAYRTDEEWRHQLSLQTDTEYILTTHKSFFEVHDDILPQPEAVRSLPLTASHPPIPP
jgi:hypothetical protein